MADPGLIALDPARLGGLEVYLQGLGDGCRRRAGRVAEAVAGSGVDAARPVAELERLAAVCRREGDEVRWRRALVEALPHDLPRPPRSFPSTTAIVAAAEALADDVRAALDEHPPRWSRLARLLDELDRGGSPLFAVTFFSSLGPVRARRLPLVLERAWSATRAGAAGRSAVEAWALLAVHGRLTLALCRASRVRGARALDERWCRVYAGLPPGDEALATVEAAATPAQRGDVPEVEAALRGAGYGLGLAATLARAVGWRRVAAVLTVDRGLIGLVAAPMALADGDGIACDGAEALLGAAAGGVTVLGALVPGATVPAGVAAGVLGGLAFLFGGCARQEPRPRETRPTVEPATGESRLPSGHASNPHVDAAGVPLPPSYG